MDRGLLSTAALESYLAGLRVGSGTHVLRGPGPARMDSIPARTRQVGEVRGQQSCGPHSPGVDGHGLSALGVGTPLREIMCTA